MARLFQISPGPEGGHNHAEIHRRHVERACHHERYCLPGDEAKEVEE
jgi:hypothetical protein